MEEGQVGLSLYELNKQVVKQHCPPLDSQQLKHDLIGIEIWYAWTHNHYFMLLCHDRRDYTIFNLTDSKKYNKATEELKETLENRGKVLDITYELEYGSFAIWIDINKEPFLYNLFPYDAGVIEV